MFVHLLASSESISRVISGPTHTQLPTAIIVPATATCDGILGSDLPDSKVKQRHARRNAANLGTQHVLVLSDIACSQLPMDITIASADHGRGRGPPFWPSSAPKSLVPQKDSSQEPSYKGADARLFLSSYCRALVHPPFPTRQRWFFFRATTDSRSLPTLGCFRISRGSGSPPRKAQEERRARDGTLFHIRAARRPTADK